MTNSICPNTANWRLNQVASLGCSLVALLAGCQPKPASLRPPPLAAIEVAPLNYEVSVPLSKKDGPFPRTGDQDITWVTYTRSNGQPLMKIEVTTPARATFGIEWSSNLVDWNRPTTWYSNDTGRMGVPVPADLEAKFFRVAVDHPLDP